MPMNGRSISFLVGNYGLPIKLLNLFVWLIEVKPISKCQDIWAVGQ